MAVAMAVANATAMAATTAVAAEMAKASNRCFEGICIVDATAGAITESAMAVEAAAR